MAMFVLEKTKYHQIDVTVVLYYWQNKPDYEKDVCFVSKYSKSRNKI